MEVKTEYRLMGRPKGRKRFAYSGKVATLEAAKRRAAFYESQYPEWEYRVDERTVTYTNWRTAK